MSGTENTPKLCACCRSPKVTLSCELCDEPLCRSCVQYLEESRLAFLPDPKVELLFSRYCQSCYDTHVAPAIQSYDETLERAKQVTYLSRAYRGQVPVLKKALETVSVSGARDRDETILHLAFLAALQGYNAVIRAEVSSEKVRNEGYQTSRWRGEALPAEVDQAWIERQEGHSGARH